MSRRRQQFFLLLLSMLPAVILAKGFTREHGFLSLPRFGQTQRPDAIPEIQRIDPPATSPYGYDGQFYAQLAVSPALARRDCLDACDAPAYRAGRIGLPVLAYFVGMGQPAWILQAYSVLNMAFWLLLVGILAREVGLAGLRERLLLVASAWTMGTMVSMERALTDLPALTLSLWGMLLAERHAVAGCGLLGASALFKETSVLAFPALAWIDSRHPARKLVWILPMLILPATLWHLYVRCCVPADTCALGNFALPLTGWWQKVTGEVSTQAALMPKLSLNELGASLALAFQAIYLVARPRPSSTFWRWGIGFAMLGMVLGMPVWIDANAFTRVLLPLTLAFNLLVYRHERGRSYAAWFLLGNVGLLSRVTSSWAGLAMAGWIILEISNARRPAEIEGNAERETVAAPHFVRRGPISAESQSDSVP